MLKRKTASVCLVLIMLLGAIPSIKLKAANYGGSGTMSDPYLVQTAEQLQGMRDNLSAHYKLANTIDLSGMDFKPVGRLDAPFTGSLVCELNADLTPKFVIKNLNVSVAETSYAAQNKNKWEAALFGATNGATISGIYVLDATISNKVLGDNTGAVTYGDYKPGMDEMNSAILIGQAEATTVVNCGTSGAINTRANNSAGLIGRAIGSVIENCYSTANINSEGKWNIAGLIGFSKNSSITGCFSTGNVSGTQSNIAAFVGSLVGGEVRDCYATGNASGGKESKNAFCVVQEGASVKITNCIALGSVDSEVSKKNASITSSNCWALSGKLHNIEQFKEGSLDQIKAAFANLSNWDTTGQYPKLKTVGMVTDASKYVPGAVSETPTTQAPTTQAPTTQAPSTQTGVTGEGTVKVTPEEVKSMIEALPNPDEENAITLKHKEDVKEAWKAYESLTAGEKDEFDANLAAKLASVRYKMSVLVAGELVTKLTELPETKDLTLDDVEAILALWDDYKFLDESVVGEFDADVIKKLEEAYKFAQAGAQGQLQSTYVEVDTGLTAIEKVIVIVCASMIVLAVVFDVVMGIMLFRRFRKLKATGDEVKNAEEKK